jgi:hypothetical protein
LDCANVAGRTFKLNGTGSNCKKRKKHFPIVEDKYELVYMKVLKIELLLS